MTTTPTVDELFEEGLKEFKQLLQSELYEEGDNQVTKNIINAVCTLYPKYKGLIKLEDEVDQQFKIAAVDTYYNITHKKQVKLTGADKDEATNKFNNHINTLWREDLSDDLILSAYVADEINKIVSNSPLLTPETEAVLTLECSFIRGANVYDSEDFCPILNILSSFKLRIYITP